MRRTPSIREPQLGSSSSCGCYCLRLSSCAGGFCRHTPAASASAAMRRRLRPPCAGVRLALIKTCTSARATRAMRISCSRVLFPVRGFKFCIFPARGFNVRQNSRGGDTRYIQDAHVIAHELTFHHMHPSPLSGSESQDAPVLRASFEERFAFPQWGPRGAFRGCA